MSNIEANYKRYTLIYILATLIPFLMIYVKAKTGIDLMSFYANIILLLIPPMIEGERYVAKNNEYPKLKSALKFALLSTLICVTISILKSLSFYGYLIYEGELSLNDDETILMILAIAVTMITSTITISFFSNLIFYAIAAWIRKKLLEKSK